MHYWLISLYVSGMAATNTIYSMGVFFFTENETHIILVAVEKDFV